MPLKSNKITFRFSSEFNNSGEGQKRFVSKIQGKRIFMMKFTKCPTAESSLKLLFSPWFVCEVLALYQLYVLQFTIKEQFPETFSDSFYHHFHISNLFKNKPLIIIFKEKKHRKHSKFFWKAQNESFYELDFNRGENKVLTKYFLNFLLSEIKTGSPGEF